MNDKYYKEVANYIELLQTDSYYPFAITEPTEEDICKIASILSNGVPLDLYDVCTSVLGTAPQYIYYLTINDKVIDNWELAEIARIVDNQVILPTDFHDLRRFKEKCKGILQEIYHPTVEFLVKLGQKEKAVQLYHRQNRGTDLKYAEKIIEKMIQARNYK